MDGLMMEYPLTLAFILRRAETLFGHKAIVTRRPEKTIHRYTYADFVPGAKKLAVALEQLGLRRGDRVATLCWNQYEPLEAYFGIPLAGNVLHTINPRLHPSDLAYIVNDAEDRVLIIDDTLLPLLEKFRADVRIEHIVVIEHGGQAPAGTIGYEKLLAGADANAFAYPELDEREAAAMCYPSGTTGRPKGVVYSPRALVLHSLGQASGAVGVLESDVVLPVVPMFHVNAWGLPFTCTMIGATQVHPGPHLDAESLCELFVGEHVTYGRADDLARAPAQARRATEGLRPVAAPPARGRRLGRAKVDDPRLRRAARAACPPRLGHDRDDAARCGVQPDERSRAGGRRDALRLSRKAGVPGAARRDPRPERRGRRTALGREVDG